MSKHLRMILIRSLLYLAIFSSCKKDIFHYPYPGHIKDSTAQFSLVQADTCNAVAFAGQFTAGVPVGNDTINIEANFTRAGKWSLRASTVNGVALAGSGVVAATGVQLITLHASGTPVIPGNFIMELIKGSGKIYVPFSVIRNDLPAEAVPSVIYWKGTIGGTSYDVQLPQVTADNTPFGYGGGDTASFSSYVAPPLYPNPPGTASISLQKGELYHFKSSSEEDFKAFFRQGGYRFSPKVCDSVSSEGIFIFILDGNNVDWSSILDSGSQEGSYFNITGIEDGHNLKGQYFVKVISKFQCKLHNYVTGETSEIRNGEMVSYFIKP